MTNGSQLWVLVLALAGGIALAATGCGEQPFDGSEFEVTVGGNSKTFHSTQKVSPCSQDNAAVYDNFGVTIGDSFEPRYFKFRVMDTAAGTYRVSPSDSIGGDDVEQFEIEFKIDEGASVTTYETDPLLCERDSRVVIQGKDYGLVWGTASGEICPEAGDGWSRFNIEFAFAEADSGRCF